MTFNLSERTRAIVTETLPLMEQHRAPLEEALERSMMRQQPEQLPETAKVATNAIMDMLLGHARQLSGNEPLTGIVETAGRHRALALGAEHYSSFGDALKPIMMDVLGRKAMSHVAAAWGDAYWAIARMLFRQDIRLAA